MIAVLDACTVFNLVNLTDDFTYVEHSKKVFSSLCIVPKVFDEIREHINDGFISDKVKSDNELIYKQIKSLTDNYEINEKVKIHFTKQLDNRKDGKEDGEFMSLCYCALKSRELVNDAPMTRSLKVHFVTDDMPATEEFSSEFSTNQIGSIIDTTDLLTILCLNGIINKNDLLKRLNFLIKTYNKTLLHVDRELKSYKDKNKFSNNLSKKLDQILTEIIHHLEENSHDKIKDLMEEKSNKKEIANHSEIKKLLSKLNNNTQNSQKITYIRTRIAKIENLWDMN